MDTSSDMLSSLLSDPEKLKSMISVASNLFGSAPAASPSSSATATDSQSSPFQSTHAPPAEPSPLSHTMGSSSTGNDSYDPSAELLKKAIPFIQAIARGGQSSINQDRLNLLRSLKPFVGTSLASHFDHAIKLASVARMTQSAMREFGNQSGDQTFL